ncbi:hemerythrin HHE cation binding domain-containing protein [Stackebrandtia endophytica]|uniref:Hemerythrin HHE cation binding domain-containing protein n=1 Tax=Stackebrandtia endophytica TaxID=1496996 RepID=A0A543AYH5_9ACTN|nr:hemerythrin HHE cation binding domain-containing protein [Stackebrandtia endophytica]
MTGRDTDRLVAWSNELRGVHDRLRSALRVVRESLGSDSVEVTADLLIYCRGFCAALGRHHRGEDRGLFPAIEAAHPELAPVLRKLEQDHSMIDYLLKGLEAAANRSASSAEIEKHLEGVSAIMENHFAYEERQLLKVLESLALRADPATVLGDF